MRRGRRRGIKDIPHNEWSERDQTIVMGYKYDGVGSRPGSYPSDFNYVSLTNIYVNIQYQDGVRSSGLVSASGITVLISVPTCTLFNMT